MSSMLTELNRREQTNALLFNNSASPLSLSLWARNRHQQPNPVIIDLVASSAFNEPLDIRDHAVFVLKVPPENGRVLECNCVQPLDRAK